MAYNKKNKLLNIEKVQKIYLHYQSKGCTDVYIFDTHVNPRFHISIRTFYSYLTVNVQQELKKLQQHGNTGNDK